MCLVLKILFSRDVALCCFVIPDVSIALRSFQNVGNYRVSTELLCLLVTCYLYAPLHSMHKL